MIPCRNEKGDEAALEVSNLSGMIVIKDEGMTRLLSPPAATQLVMALLHELGKTILDTDVAPEETPSKRTLSQ